VWDGNGTSSLAAGLPGSMDLPGGCMKQWPWKPDRSRLVLVLYAEGLAWFLPRSLGGTGAAAILAAEGTPPAAGLDRRQVVPAQVYDQVVDGARKAIARAPASAALRATVRAAQAGLDARYRRGLDGAARPRAVWAF
jgi:hypothetical protein